MIDAEVKERRRMKAFRRILLTLELLREHRLGLKTEEVHKIVCERYGENFNLRTTRRDLFFLHDAGLADVVVGFRNKHTWKPARVFNRQL